MDGVDGCGVQPYLTFQEESTNPPPGLVAKQPFLPHEVYFCLLTGLGWLVGWDGGWGKWRGRVKLL